MGEQRSQKRNKNIKTKESGNTPTFMRCSKCNAKREFYSEKCIHQEKRKISNNESNFIHQRTKLEQTKLNVCKEENNKNQSENK